MITKLLTGLLRRPRSAATSLSTLAKPVSKRALVSTAVALVGPRLQERFRQYVSWLDGQGYGFGSCEESPRGLARRTVYLRYDVHVRDLDAAVVLAALHEELQIPGSFQICWNHTQAEIEASVLFCKLQAFDPRYVQFGLHCSPESQWLIARRFDGRSLGLERFVASGGARAMIAEWFDAYTCQGDDAPVLREARGYAEASFAGTALSFQRAFGHARTVSGHGTPLSAAYLRAVAEKPEIAPIAAYLHPVDFLTLERIAPHGFQRELTHFENDGLPGSRIMFEGPIADMAARYRERMSNGGGFVVLFHPLSWVGDYFLPFLTAIASPTPA